MKWWRKKSTAKNIVKLRNVTECKTLKVLYVCISSFRILIKGKQNENIKNKTNSKQKL